MRFFFSLFLLCCGIFAQQRVGKYEVSIRLPEGGLHAGEEMQIEFRVVDASRIDPLIGASPVIRADVRSAIEMPTMPGMPKLEEIAHPEGVPGEYGIHPVFVHGGEFRLLLAVTPPGGEPFQVEFPLKVDDTKTVAKSKAPIYRLEISGKPEDFTLRVKGPEGWVTDYDTVHERKMHLIAIRRDLKVFEHLHPEPSPVGIFHLRHRWPAGGDYTLFTDIAPRGKGSQIVSARMKVKGPAAAPVLANAVQASIEDALTAGKTTRAVVHFAPPLPLEPYLGAMGHLMAVTEDGETLVHSHPADEKNKSGELAFLVRLPKPGRYRAWLEVQSAGKIYTGELTIEGKP